MRKDAKNKAARFCAYQERTQQQVREKLIKVGLDQNDAEEILSELITEGFINEERFAKAYAGGKFRQKKWGKVKIRYELQKRGLTDYCIESGLAEIEEENYIYTALELIENKGNSLKAQNKYNEFEFKGAIIRFMTRKGFESELIKRLLNDNS